MHENNYNLLSYKKIYLPKLNKKFYFKGGKSGSANDYSFPLFFSHLLAISIFEIVHGYQKNLSIPNSCKLDGIQNLRYVISYAKSKLIFLSFLHF